MELVRDNFHIVRELEVAPMADAPQNPVDNPPLIYHAVEKGLAMLSDLITSLLHAKPSAHIVAAVGIFLVVFYEQLSKYTPFEAWLPHHPVVQFLVHAAPAALAAALTYYKSEKRAA